MNNYPHSPSYTLHPSSPSQSDPITRNTPSPPPQQPSHSYLPPLPIPIHSSSSYNGAHQNHFQRQMYPTSSPYQPHQSSPDPSPHSKSRFPHPTSSFTNGYASPATSAYSSEPGSRDEIDMMEPGTLGGSNFLPHGNLPGVDGLFRTEHGMYLDKHINSRHENRDGHCRRGWNMRDFQLIQTVGMSFLF